MIEVAGRKSRLRSHLGGIVHLHLVKEKDSYIRNIKGRDDQKACDESKFYRSNPSLICSQVPSKPAKR